MDGTPSSRAFGPAPLNGRALPDQQVRPRSSGTGTQALLAQLVRRRQASAASSESDGQPGRSHITPAEYLEHDCIKGGLLQLRTVSTNLRGPDDQ